MPDLSVEVDDLVEALRRIYPADRSFVVKNDIIFPRKAPVELAGVDRFVPVVMQRIAIEFDKLLDLPKQCCGNVLAGDHGTVTQHNGLCVLMGATGKLS